MHYVSVVEDVVGFSRQQLATQLDNYCCLHLGMRAIVEYCFVVVGDVVL